MRFGCIGEKLGHSFSAKIHTLLGDEDYELKELAPGEVAPFLAAREFLGINVTIPYKETVLPFLDGIDEAAGRIGAVNTIVNRGGSLFGYNTDFYGMTALLDRAKIAVSGRRVAILGSGGTSKTAHAVCSALGAGEILTVSRTPKGEQISYEELLRRGEKVDILINTTPVGMFPENEGLPVDLSRFPALSGVADAVYNPLRTRLVQSARERGIPAEGGLLMLCAQGVFASEIFHNTKYEEDTLDRVFRAVKKESESLVLIGMPGAGKTTLGKKIAEKTGRPFFDADEIFISRFGDIPAFFRERGEEAFRREEAAILSELAKKSGAVIATGGGAVLCKSAMAALRQNGMILFLDRAPDALLPDDTRPTASTKEAIRLLYDARLPLYQSAADLVLPIYEKNGAPDFERAVGDLFRMLG